MKVEEYTESELFAISRVKWVAQTLVLVSLQSHLMHMAEIQPMNYNSPDLSSTFERASFPSAK